MKPIATVVLLVGAAAMGCDDGLRDPPMPRPVVSKAAFSSVSDSQWKALASRRIFFGHQSVGRNILAGLATVLKEHPEIRLRIVGSGDPSSVVGPALIEADIGQNTRPGTKADAFAKALEGGFGAETGAVAMYKYCYVDVQPGTNPDALFSDYVGGIDQIRARYPGLTVVHVTLPLHTANGGLKERLATRLGIGTELALDIKRNRYNDLLRARYTGSEPLFDLALLESTRADGSRAYVGYRGRKVYMLAPEWTDDGGHLGEHARNRVAEQLLVFLAELPGTSGTSQGR